ncbi:MAG: putative Ig domain-containing protein [Bacteroidota bacterium]
MYRAGDVNNDGFGDLIIGVPGTLDNRIQRGAGYIVYGTDESLPTIFDLSSVDGNNGFIILGNDELGYAVGGAGDFNNDGIDDVMISQPGNSFFAQQFGSTFIIFGSTSFEPILRISELDETDYVRIKGEDDEDLAGITSDAVGDFNGDGISDIILGATKNDNNTGAAYIIFGSSDPPSLLELSSLDGINGLKLLGVAPERSTGNSVSSAGDVNGDGLDDVIIGSFYQSANRDQLGTNYVVFGTKDASLKELSLADLNGDNGFSITGQPGWDVSNAGDINGDTFSDVIIGVPYNSDSFQRPRTGSCYVILGNGPLEPILINPIPDQQAIVGEEYFFTIPLNTFEDLNRNDSQTISVSLEGGGLLPDWLAFDPQDNSLKGTPLNQDVGTISLEVKNTDEDGLFATDVFELDVIIVTAVSNYTNNGFKMYPIPFSSQLNINIQNDEVGLLVVTIHDLTGKLIYTETMIKDRVIFKSTVNASDLNSGVYLMQVDMNDKFKSVYRIIKE